MPTAPPKHPASAEVGRRTWTTARETLVAAPEALVTKPLQALGGKAAGLFRPASSSGRRKGGERHDHDSDVEDAGDSSSHALLPAKPVGGTGSSSGGGNGGSGGGSGGGPGRLSKSGGPAAPHYESHSP